MSIKILIAIPCLYGAAHCKEAIDSVVFDTNVGVLLIDNGADQDVKDVLHRYWHPGLHNVHFIRNDNNIYVNPAWQQAVDYFLEHREYSHLVIMNSDIIMHHQWAQVCTSRWTSDPDEILIPIMTSREIALSRDKINTGVVGCQIPTGGTPGAFFTMNRKQALLINPLPTEIKVWFGDNWIFGILRNTGYRTIIPDNLYSYHYWSKTVSIVPGVSELIEQDKVFWKDIVEPRMQESIKKYGNYILIQPNTKNR